jgi:GntR family transcriptional regulator
MSSPFESSTLARAPRGRADPRALQRSGAHALYEQIADRLRHHILATPGTGTQLPTEDALMRTYAVSRSTVRKAIQQLADEGVLLRRRGKGTFVATPLPQIVHALDRFAPFFETFKRAGEVLETSIIDASWSDAPELPAALDAWPRPVFSYLRLYRSQGVPHAVTRVWLPPVLGRRVSRGDFEATPIYEVLRKKLKVKLSRSETVVSGRQPSPEIGHLLGLSQSSFLLVLDRISYDANHAPVELTTHYLRPDVYQLSLTLMAPAGPGT